jgi:hypothetical protein
MTATVHVEVARELDELRGQIRYSRSMIQFIRESRDHNPAQADAAIERQSQKIHACERRIELLKYETFCEGCGECGH